MSDEFAAKMTTNLIPLFASDSFVVQAPTKAISGLGGSLGGLPLLLLVLVVLLVVPPSAAVSLALAGKDDFSDI